MDCQVPTELPEDTDAALICKLLMLYVAEGRKNDGSQYLPKTVYLLLTGLLRHMLSINPDVQTFWTQLITILKLFTVHWTMSFVTSVLKVLVLFSRRRRFTLGEWSVGVRQSQELAEKHVLHEREEFLPLWG